MVQNMNDGELFEARTEGIEPYARQRNQRIFKLGVLRPGEFADSAKRVSAFPS